MNSNGHHRTVAEVDADQRDLRQLMMLEFRALRAELKRHFEELGHVKEIGQHNAKALDLLLAYAKADEEAAANE